MINVEEMRAEFLSSVDPAPRIDRQLWQLEKDGWKEQLLDEPDYYYFTHRDYPGVMIKWWGDEKCVVIKL